MKKNNVIIITLIVLCLVCFGLWKQSVPEEETAASENEKTFEYRICRGCDG